MLAVGATDAVSSTAGFPPFRENSTSSVFPCRRLAPNPVWPRGAVVGQDDRFGVADIEFDAEGATLRGWLYRPRSGASDAPVVVMAHGYNCLKEFYLDQYAASVASAGHVVLAYDHRNFGESEGEPRQELDPWVQVRDYRHAITFAQTLDGVDGDRVGVWGSSYAGGHPLVVGAIDRRGRCMVTPVPTIHGWEAKLCP